MERATDNLPEVMQNASSMTPLEILGAIQHVEGEALQLPQVDLSVINHFADGVYGREILIPKGTFITGAIHKKSDINVVLYGDISVLTTEGLQRVKGPCVLVAEPGVKKAGYAHEDTRWLTIHVTEETDIEKIEVELLETDGKTLEEFRERLVAIAREGTACHLE